VKEKSKSEKKRSSISLVYLFLKHYIAGNNRYGIHSPFVYNLLTGCIYNKTLPGEFQAIEEQRKKLEKDNRTIEINDLGSKKDKEIEVVKHCRTISGIAKKSLKSRRQAFLLYRLAKYFECKNILELGTCFGITASYLSMARPDTVVNTIEGCPQIAGVANTVFGSLGGMNIRLHVGDIDELLLPVLNDPGSPDLVFFDANHTKQATLSYFNIILGYIKESTVLIIDDIHWSKGMEDAWKEICSNDIVSVTVDLFYMGLVFFRKGLSKENFVIRY